MSRLAARAAILAVTACLLTLGSAATPVSANETEAPLRIMFVGDSITQGRQADATYRYFVQRTLARQGVAFRSVGPWTDLAKMNGARANYLYNDWWFQPTHASKGGSKFPYHLRRVATQIKSFDPDVITLLLGYNDSNGATAGQIADSTTAYLEKVWSVDPELKFIVGQITFAHRPGFSATARRTKNVRKANQMIAAQHGDDPRVEIAHTVSDRRFPWSPKRHTYDGVHPNVSGQRLLGYEFAEAFRRAGFLNGPVSVPNSLRWDPKPVVQRLAIKGKAKNGKRSVRVGWPSQGRKIYAKEGFRLIVRHKKGSIAAVGEYTQKGFSTVQLKPGAYTASVQAQRGTMQSLPGPAKNFYVKGPRSRPRKA